MFGEVNEDSSVVHMRQELAQLIKTVPPAYQQWGHTRTTEYKKVAKKAHDAVNNERMPKHLVWAKLKEIRMFWQ